MSAKEISDLEHEIIKKEIENISFKMNEGFGSIDKILKVHFDALATKNDTEAELVGLQLNNILTEQKRTNGRVTKLEDLTVVLRFLNENKKLTALLLYGIYNALSVATIENIIKWIKYFI